MPLYPVNTYVLQENQNYSSSFTDNSGFMIDDSNNRIEVDQGEAAPTFYDLDGDGLLDMIAGNNLGTIQYWENVGTATDPEFNEDASVFGGIDVGNDTSPTFFDVDGDGDLDMITGETNSDDDGLNYFENTGTATNPVFGNNPNSGASDPTRFVTGLDTRSTPTLGDLDGDGDGDLLIGQDDGTFRFFEFDEVSGTFVSATNPMAAFDVGGESAPQLVDIDGDGDLDVISGQQNGQISLFENIGTATNANFVQDNVNPFDDIDIGAESSPFLADITGNGQLDLMVGRNNRGRIEVFGSNLNNPPCFCKGVEIATDLGPVAVEYLKPGDMVLTKDNGFQPLRWVGSLKCAAKADAAPVRIQSGAMGNAADLWVSPQHRLLVAGGKLELYFGCVEVLVPAKYLVGLPGIQVIERDHVEYFHLFFDQHEIVRSSDIWTESFHPGRQSIDALSEIMRSDLLAAYPELSTRDGLAAYGPTARMVLKNFEMVPEILTLATRPKPRRELDCYYREAPGPFTASAPSESRCYHNAPAALSRSRPRPTIFRGVC